VQWSLGNTIEKESHEMNNEHRMVIVNLEELGRSKWCACSDFGVHAWGLSWETHSFFFQPARSSHLIELPRVNNLEEIEAEISYLILKYS